MDEAKKGTAYTPPNWFKHKSSASADDKLAIIKRRTGPEGYAWYFMLLELLTCKDNHTYNIHAEHAEIAILEKCWVGDERKDDVYKFIELAVKIDLFQLDTEGNLSSRKHLEGMAKIDSIIEKRREAGRAGGYEKSKRFKQRQKQGDAKESPPGAAPAADTSSFSPEEQATISGFNEWLDCNAPRVKMMKDPFTPAQILKLGKDYNRHWERVKDVLTSMENKSSLLTNYQSANLTCRKWLRNQNITPPSKNR